MQIEAGKVRKGMLIRIDGKPGLLRVTKREKWNPSVCRLYYVNADHIPGFEIFRLDSLITIYQPEDQEGA